MLFTKPSSTRREFHNTGRRTDLTPNGHKGGRGKVRASGLAATTEILARTPIEDIKTSI